MWVSFWNMALGLGIKLSTPWLVGDENLWVLITSYMFCWLFLWSKEYNSLKKKIRYPLSQVLKLVPSILARHTVGRRVRGHQCCRLAFPMLPVFQLRESSERNMEIKTQSMLSLISWRHSVVLSETVCVCVCWEWEDLPQITHVQVLMTW